ncbi:hypothetical protein F5X99DRAFT_308649 [Biscogniauxia marginata]|nr:hypothetical protein F5X99DRAFT_308649 [Biscogniauxia marginata]
MMILVVPFGWEGGFVPFFFCIERYIAHGKQARKPTSFSRSKFRSFLSPFLLCLPLFPLLYWHLGNLGKQDFTRVWLLSPPSCLLVRGRGKREREMGGETG